MKNDKKKVQTTKKTHAKSLKVSWIHPITSRKSKVAITNVCKSADHISSKLVIPLRICFNGNGVDTGQMTGGKEKETKTGPGFGR